MSEPTKGLDISKVIEKLPPFPAAVKKLMDALEADYVKPDELEKLLIACPVIAGRVLQISNSSFYGQSRKIVSLKQAIVILGLSTLKGLIYTLSVMENFQETKPDQTGFDSHFLWRHSLYCACLAKSIASYHESKDESHVFTGTLFQHLGLMVLQIMDPLKLNQAINIAQEQKRTLFDILHEDQGINYFELSGLALDQWGFPSEVCKIVEGIQQTYSQSQTKQPLGKELEAIRISAVIAHGFDYPIQQACVVPAIDQQCLTVCFPDDQVAGACLHKADIMFTELKKVILG